MDLKLAQLRSNVDFAQRSHYWASKRHDMIAMLYWSNSAKFWQRRYEIRRDWKWPEILGATEEVMPKELRG
jgi:hypothetical protein